MSLSGIFLRFGGLLTRILQFTVSILPLGIFAYFISNLRDNNIPVSNWWYSVLGISAASTIYSVFGIVFTLCLGGSSLSGNLAVLLDIAFIGAFSFVAYATRAGTNGCDGYVYTPLGNGWSNADTGLTVASSLRRACQLNTTVFASAIVLCVLFLMTAVWQFLMVRNRQARRGYPGKV